MTDRYKDDADFLRRMANHKQLDWLIPDRERVLMIANVLEAVPDEIDELWDKAIEHAAKIAESFEDGSHRIGGICISPEIAAELPTDGDKIAPFIAKGSAVERLVNDMCKVYAHIIASHIRRPITSSTDLGE